MSVASAQVDVDRLEPRRRGKPLTADDRRAAIIEATTPLIAERGPSVTSAEIAEAAQIAQGTIFHVFGDKQALVDAVVRQAMDISSLLVELDGLITEPDLHTRLTAVIDQISAHMIKAMPVMMKCGKPKGGHDDARGHALDLRDSVARLLEPDAAALAHPPAQMAAIVFGLCLASAQQTAFGETHMPSSSDLAELFLDGARIRGDAARSQDRG
jgi:AcrR family transcriptional regulator